MTDDDARELGVVVRRWLSGSCDHGVVRAAMADPSVTAGWRAPLWSETVDLGLTAVAVPEEYDGAGAGPVELGAALEEMGRALYPGPFLATVLAGLAVTLAGDESARRELLPRIAAGTVTATLASGPTVGATPFTAELRAGTLLVTGTAPAVLDAVTADVVLAVVRTGDGVALVALDDPERVALTAMDQTRPLGRVRCVRTPARLLSAATADVATRLGVALDLAALLLAAEQLGGLVRVLETTVEHVRSRHQFGRAIGSFQAVKHRCADLLMDLESARSEVGHGLRRCRDVLVPGSDLDPDAIALEALLARTVTSEAFLRAARTSIQLHGGIGFTWEHEAHLFLKRARGGQLLLGTPTQDRSRLLALVLADAARPVAPDAPVEPGAALPDEVRSFLATHPPVTCPDRELREARFDAGLAVVHLPEGQGGRGWPAALQPVVEAAFRVAGAADWQGRNVIGLGMAMPTIAAHGTAEQQGRHLRPCFSGEEIWCQLFSEPGAGSDLAGLATRAVRDGDDFVVDGQKVWTSLGHVARYGLLLARTDPAVPKHRGLTYFLLDMSLPGVEVRPLRQLTGEAEFNEVHLTRVRVPATAVLGGVGAGWSVAMTTLTSERAAIGGAGGARHAGPIGQALTAYAETLAAGTAEPAVGDRLAVLWARTEAARLTVERAAARPGGPGPEGSVAKIQMAEGNQAVYDLCVEIAGPEGLYVDDYDPGAGDTSEVFGGSDVRKAWLRSLANSIEGGTSEVLRNVLGERVLGLPGEPRVDRDLPWQETVRS